MINMKRFFKSKYFALIILMIAALVTVSLGSMSFSKYVSTWKDQIVAEYADFRLSHDGNNKSAIITAISDDSKHTHEGFMSISVNNFIEEDGAPVVSEREIVFSMETPSKTELSNQAIYDVWGQKIGEPTHASKLYDVRIVDEVTNAELTNKTLQSDNPQTISIKLEISRRNTYKDTETALSSSDEYVSGTTEYITVVIRTTKPYRNTIVFTIAVSDSKVLFSSMKKEYYGFVEHDINIITAPYYNFVDGTSTKPVEIAINYSDLVFDYERFRLSVEGNLVKDGTAFTPSYSFTSSSIILYLPQASNVTLRFYQKGTSYYAQASVLFSVNKAGVESDKQYTSDSAGLNEITSGSSTNYYALHYSIGG